MGEAEVEVTGSLQDQDARTLGERRERAETRFFAYVYRASQLFTGLIVGEREASRPSEQKKPRYKCHHSSERGSETSTAWRLEVKSFTNFV